MKDQLYIEKPELKGKTIQFFLDDREIHTNKTIEENKIKKNCYIIIKIKPEKKSKKNDNDKISVIIEDEEQKSYSFICKKQDQFSSLVKQYFEKEPQLKNKNHYFMANNNKIDISKTLEENKITNGIVIYYKAVEDKDEDEDEEDICVIIKSTAQDFKSSFICKKSDKFKDLQEQLYERKKDLKDKYLYYVCAGNPIDIEKTIEENKIKDNDIIVYNIFDE